MYGFTVHASDGDVGHVRDLYFDDREWKVRYMVVNTGPWLLGRRVLLAPRCVELVRWQMDELEVGLTQDQVAHSPHIDLAKPVSRQREEELHRYYGWAPYWRTGALPLIVAEPPPGAAPSAEREGDPHLRSTREVTGYRIQATDGEIGHVDDFFVDATSWTIRYVVVDTGDWLPGRKVLVGQRWLKDVDWAASTARLDLTREEVEQSPEYDPAAPIARSYEVELHDHYGISGYWLQSPM
ncbi:MAG: PRC-barrel domain-containing protein [Anaerolineae bacterium]|nr:PRC-barrel domain-containing protein [Anaerolineae bacterium]